MVDSLAADQLIVLPQLSKAGLDKLRGSLLVEHAELGEGAHRDYALRPVAMGYLRG